MMPILIAMLIGMLILIVHNYRKDKEEEWHDLEDFIYRLPCKTEKEWNNNCDKVKKEFNGYPEWWYKEIVGSSIAKAMQMYDEYSIPKHTFLSKELVDKFYHNHHGSFALKTVDELWS